MNKVTIKKLPKSRLEVTVEIPIEEFVQYNDRAVTELGEEIEINGFRKGTAPKELILQKAGDTKITERAAKIAIEENYPKIVAEKKIEPFGYPEIEIVKLAAGNPFEFKLIVAVFPEVELGDYKKTAKQFTLKVPEITTEDIERLKMQKAEHEKEHRREDLLNKLRETANIDLPEIMIARETDRMIEELRKKTPQALNMNFEEYLQKIKKTEKDLRDSFNSDNEKKIMNYLILQEIAKVEKIEVAEKDVDDVIKKVTEGEPKENLDMDHLREYYKDVVKNEKVFSYLETFFKK